MHSTAILTKETGTPTAKSYQGALRIMQLHSITDPTDDIVASWRLTTTEDNPNPISTSPLEVRT